MIKVLIVGCNGKMGQEVAKAIERNDNFQTVCGVDRLDTGDNNFPVYTDTSKIAEEPDVIIDFSIPVATFNILKYAQAKKIPVVIATTGFTDEDLEKIKEYSKEFPIFLSSNMSFEVNLMNHIVAEVAKYLKNFSSDTQFIVITHRKPTMELADCLYGVTMEEKGVSKMVSVKLSDAVKNSTEGA